MMSLQIFFRLVLDKHAPIRKKIVRGNEAPFLTKELSKVIMNRSKLIYKMAAS